MNFLKSGAAFVVLALGVSTGFWGQLCTIKGVVEDALTGEALIGAYVKSGNVVVATDFDGTFSMPVPKGEATLEVSYIGYDSRTKTVQCDGTGTAVRFRLETLIMKEAVVAIAYNRWHDYSFRKKCSYELTTRPYILSWLAKSHLFLKSHLALSKTACKK